MKTDKHRQPNEGIGTEKLSKIDKHRAYVYSRDNVRSAESLQKLF